MIGAKSISFSFLGSSQNYRISFDSMPSSLAQRISKEELALFLELLEKAQYLPRKTLSAVEEFQRKHPELPEALNLLSYVYIHTKQITKAEALIEQTYSRFPEYLFARINFADQCLRKKHFEKIPQIFPEFNLQKLFPDKTIYHYLEFRGFITVVGFYHLAMHQKSIAKSCLALAKELDPDHSSVKLLEKKLYPFPFSLLRRFRN